MLRRRRRSKNCGGGIAPAAIGALIEATHCSVNAYGGRLASSNAAQKS